MSDFALRFFRNCQFMLKADDLLKIIHLQNNSFSNYFYLLKLESFELDSQTFPLTS